MSSKIINVYGIKTCSSVKKATAFFDTHKINYNFIDLKTTKLDKEKIKKWLEKTSIDILFNTKGRMYKTLNLKDKSLTQEEKIQWLADEHLLFKRPIVEFNDKLIVGFNDEYQQIFG